MKIAFIHNERKIGTGAHYINDLISKKLKERGVVVKHFYPSSNLIDAPVNLKGLSNILFFYSLLEHRDEILKCDLIQGTTYTPLTFLTYDIPVVSHFGSTTQGFLDSIPLTYKVNENIRDFWYLLKDAGVLKTLNVKTRRPLRDIADIEKFVANRADMVIATSKKVAKELGSLGVKKSSLKVVHNAIEDYWFKLPSRQPAKKCALVFLGRLGGDSFNLKLKGLDRLYDFYSAFPEQPKHTFAITKNEVLTEFLNKHLPNHTMHANLQKDLIPGHLNKLSGSILFIPSRYEGFSLSLIEGMSQGLIPIVYPVGIAPEVIENGKNGFIVTNQEQAHQCAKKIIGNQKLRKKMAAASRKSALAFNSDKMADHLGELYSQVLARSKKEQKSLDKRWSIRKWLSVWG